ncbi:hypothetical protein [Cupriavidus necator]|nr:hypothetical protein [Cupriavidus necator]MDX6010094.1 hypothetical protein [Cupriavidus necator]
MQPHAERHHRKQRQAGTASLVEFVEALTIVPPLQSCMAAPLN